MNRVLQEDTTRAKDSDACVVVYSIADKASFRTAQEALAGLAQHCREQAHRPVATSPLTPGRGRRVTLGNNQQEHNNKHPLKSRSNATAAVDQQQSHNNEVIKDVVDSSGHADHLAVPVVLLGNKKDLAHLRQVCWLPSTCIQVSYMAEMYSYQPYSFILSLIYGHIV